MGGTQFIVAGYFIDGSGAVVRRKVFLAVEDSRIAAIGPAADLPRLAASSTIVDYSHCVILPALVDCSVALTRSPSVDWQVRLAADAADLADKASMVERHLRYCHAYGVQGVAASEALTELVVGEAGGMAPESLIDIRSAGGLCLSRRDCAAGAMLSRDFLKIAYSGNIEEQDPQDPRLDQDELRHILRQRGGKKAVVVANGRQPVAEALAAGCDAIEQGYAMGEDNLRTMAARQILWIPSVLRAKNGLDGASSGGEVCCRFSQRYVAPGKPVPGAEAFWKKLLGEQLAQLRLARELGVPTAVGTGAGSVGILHGESLAEEMKLFIKAGYSPAASIRCASENGARFFGMEKLGALTVGRHATFLISRGSVQQLPRKLAYLEGIYVAGEPSGAYHKNPVTA